MRAKGQIRAFRQTLREFERVLSDSWDRTCAGSGVTMAQCHLLMELEGAAPASVKDLADALGLDRSTVSRTVEALVGMGLVQRDEDPSDRRLQRLQLTRKGLKVTESLHVENDAYFGQVLDELPADRREEVLEAFELLVKASLGNRQTRE